MKYSVANVLTGALYAIGVSAQVNPGNEVTPNPGGTVSGISQPPNPVASTPPSNDNNNGDNNNNNNNNLIGDNTQTSRGVANCRNRICYSMTVPQSTASRGSGSIYFQIVAPDTFAWVGMGTGNGMADSNMFIIYQNGQGNVTLSGRQASGYTMPTVPSSNAPQLQLLGGSGVGNGFLVANFRCLNCQSWKSSTLDFTSNEQPMMGAWQEGDAINSLEATAQIGVHTGSPRIFSFDMTDTTVSVDSNPFVGNNAFPPELTQDSNNNNGGNASDANEDGENAGMGGSDMLSRSLPLLVAGFVGVPLFFMNL